MSTLGDRIKKMRGARSQKWLAEQLGVPPTTLSNYENNKSELNFATILALKTIFKVDTDWLLFGDTVTKSIPGNIPSTATAESNTGCEPCRELLRQLGIANERIYQMHERETELLKKNTELEKKAWELEEKNGLLHAEKELLESKLSLSPIAEGETLSKKKACS